MCFKSRARQPVWSDKEPQMAFYLRGCRFKPHCSWKRMMLRNSPPPSNPNPKKKTFCCESPYTTNENVTQGKTECQCTESRCESAWWGAHTGNNSRQQILYVYAWALSGGIDLLWAASGDVNTASFKGKFGSIPAVSDSFTQSNDNPCYQITARTARIRPSVFRYTCQY